MGTPVHVTYAKGGVYLHIYTEIRPYILSQTKKYGMVGVPLQDIKHNS